MTRTHSTFVLSRPHGTVEAHGARATFTDAGAAASALRSGSSPALVGALPFAQGGACALSEPTQITHTPRMWCPPPDLPPVSALSVDECRESEHVDRVRTAVDVLRHNDSPLHKVVLARSLTLTAETEVDPSAVLAALVEGNPSGNGYLVDLSAADEPWTGRTLVGSSPEVLIRKRGNVITCHPLAGSAPRHADAEQDRAQAAALADSGKDRREHAFVVDAIRQSLGPFCRSLDIPDEPTLTRTPQLWHLGTPIRGEVLRSDTTSLDLALALHPTPAVCGTPTDLAYETITELEGDRGFYAGAVGWCSADGDGEWMVTIRCAEISSDHKHVTAYAGGGIVAESDPDAELRETIVKFGTILSALGVRQ